MCSDLLDKWGKSPLLQNIERLWMVCKQWNEGTSEIPNTSRALFQVCFLYWYLNVLSSIKCSVDNMLTGFYPLDRKLDIPGKKEYQFKDYSIHQMSLWICR